MCELLKPIWMNFVFENFFIFFLSDQKDMRNRQCSLDTRMWTSNICSLDGIYLLIYRINI